MSTATQTQYRKRDRVVTPDGLGHVVHVYNSSDQVIQSFGIKVNGEPKIFSIDLLRPATSKDFKKGKAEIYKRADGKWDYKVKSKNNNVIASSKQGYANRVDMIDVLNNNFIDFEIVRV